MMVSVHPMISSSVSGFVINVEKSHLEPVNAGPWLGLFIYRPEERNMFYVPEEKVLRLKSAIACILDCNVIGARKLASIVGQVISMSLAIGSIARLRTRCVYIIFSMVVGLGPTLCA